MFEQNQRSSLFLAVALNFLCFPEATRQLCEVIGLVAFLFKASANKKMIFIKCFSECFKDLWGLIFSNAINKFCRMDTYSTESFRV